jgi:hypothetical protein
MINGSTAFGRAVLVFFWGGLAASFVNALYVFWHFNSYWIAWLVVIFNIAFVTIKNIIIPPRQR